MVTTAQLEHIYNIAKINSSVARIGGNILYNPPEVLSLCRRIMKLLKLYKKGHIKALMLQRSWLPSLRLRTEKN
jgi:hypothetical protein